MPAASRGSYKKHAWIRRPVRTGLRACSGPGRRAALLHHSASASGHADAHTAGRDGGQRSGAGCPLRIAALERRRDPPVHPVPACAALPPAPPSRARPPGRRPAPRAASFAFPMRALAVAPHQACAGACAVPCTGPDARTDRTHGRLRAGYMRQLRTRSRQHGRNKGRQGAGAGAGGGITDEKISEPEPRRHGGRHAPAPRQSKQRGGGAGQHCEMARRKRPKVQPPVPHPGRGGGTST